MTTPTPTGAADSVTAPTAFHPAGPCVICGSDEPFTGTCGSGDQRALCKQPTPPAQVACSVLEDAARWQMAVLIGNEVMLHPEKRTHPAAVKAYMDAVHSGLDLTGAVDAARKQGGA